MPFIKLTGIETGGTFLVNIDNVLHMKHDDGATKILFEHDTWIKVRETVDDIDKLIQKTLNNIPDNQPNYNRFTDLDIE